MEDYSRSVQARLASRPVENNRSGHVRRILPALLILLQLNIGFANDKTDAPGEAKRQPAKQKAGVQVKTFGGIQFWGDLVWHHGYRIQQNVKTKHYRLLDADNFRHASGTLAECKLALKQISDDKKLGPMKGKAVILIHGIVRSSKSFGKLHDRLKQEGYVTIGFDYPSTQVALPELAEYLHSVIESLDGIEEINFVVHSMGGLLVRTYLMQHRNRRIKRMVMMGVPNKGAALADMFKGNPLFKVVMGPAGQQLGTDTTTLIGKLPIPDFEFGVIAGGRDSERGYNPLIPGDDDWTVSVDSTRLPGAADFILVKSMHSFMMTHKDSMDATVRFLKTGKFRQNEPAQPIAKKP